MKNLLRVQIISTLSLSSVTLAICLVGKLNSETFTLFETLIVKMAFTSVDDFQTAFNACVSVRDNECFQTTRFLNISFIS